MATRALPTRPRTPRPAHAPRLHVVPGRKEGGKGARRGSSLPIVILVMFMVFGVAVLQAWVGQDGLRAAVLEREVQHEQERLTLLRARVAQLSSPHRLRGEAQKLGLVPVGAPVFIRVPVQASEAPAAPADLAKRLASPSP